MKFENLNEGKFEKIEKNELGKLVGGTCEYEESEGASVDMGSGGTCTYSNDWDNREYGENGDVISGDCKFICGSDMPTADYVPQGIVPGGR